MIRVDFSPIHGKGLFCCGSITSEQEIAVTHFYSNKHKDWVNLTPNCMYNHSFEPNCESFTTLDDGVKIKILRSLRDISHGEELLVDFSKDKDLEQPESSWK